MCKRGNYGIVLHERHVTLDHAKTCRKRSYMLLVIHFKDNKRIQESGRQNGRFQLGADSRFSDTGYEYWIMSIILGLFVPFHCIDANSTHFSTEVIKSDFVFCYSPLHLMTCIRQRFFLFLYVTQKCKCLIHILSNAISYVNSVNK